MRDKSRDSGPPGFFSIGEKNIGAGSPCFVIAEIAQAHDGSLGTAHAYIDAVAKTGADAIKFQTHIADAESTHNERFRVATFPQDNTRYEYWKRMEFTREQWVGLANHAHEKGLIFLSSPFSIEAIDLLEDLGMPAWKIGSGEVCNLPLLDRAAQTGKPVLLSSGMSSWKELDEAVSCIEASVSPYAVFQCTTSYPCPPEELGLNVLQEMQLRYGCPVGLSDHSGNHFGGIAAAVLGADLIEVHTVFSKECFGPDVSSSVTTGELKQLVNGIRYVQQALKHPVKKDVGAEAREELRVLFGKSLVATKPLSEGHKLQPHDVAARKPGGGIGPNRISEIIGRKLTRHYSVNEKFEEQDLE